MDYEIYTEAARHHDAPKPKRDSWTVFLVATIFVIYGVSFCLPVVRVGDRPETGWDIFWEILKSILAFEGRDDANSLLAMWLPNPLLWLGLGFLWFGRPSCALILGLIATTLAWFSVGQPSLWRLVHTGQLVGEYTYGSGAYVWLASMVTLCIAGILLLFKGRFRGILRSLRLPTRQRSFTRSA